MNNGLNMSDARLNEMKEETNKNKNILTDIQAARTSLSQERQSFDTYKQEQLSKIDEDRLSLKRESDNIDRVRKGLSNEQIAQVNAAKNEASPDTAEILANIQAQRSLLEQEKQDFEDYKVKEVEKINAERLDIQKIQDDKNKQ